MKTILDSIIKVEQDLQKKTIDARNEAKQILDTAREKVETLENQFIEEFDKEEKQRMTEIQKGADEYAQGLLEKTHAQMEDKRRLVEKRRDEIIDKIVKSVLNPKK